MRSRNSRSFTVELKSKRPSATSAPPSIWGKAASLFKATSEPSNPKPVQKTASPALPNPTVGVASEAEKQPRRILRDLRVESAPLEEVPPIRVTRSNRKRGRTMSENIERQGELPIESAPTAPNAVIDTVSTAAPKSVELAPIEAVSEDSLWEASEPAREVTQGPQILKGNTQIIAPQATSGRDRKWTRRVEDLPRGERWKRRLPSVCR